jgi:hypothetical protein
MVENAHNTTGIEPVTPTPWSSVLSRHLATSKSSEPFDNNIVLNSFENLFKTE